MQKPKQFKPQRATGVSKFTPKNQKRVSRVRLGYDREWDKYRFRFVHHNNTCYACGFPGGKSLHVDHIIPHRGNEELFWKLDNLIALCIRCHTYVTHKFDVLSPPDTEGKLIWINEQRKLLNITKPSKIVPKK